MLVGGTEVNPELVDALHRLAYPVLLVDAGAQVLFANRAADDLLVERGSLRIERAQLSSRRLADTCALHRLIAATAQGGSGGSLVLSREARASMIVLVLPSGAQSDSLLRRFRRLAIIFIKDLEAPVQLALTCFAEHFRLTPAQASLAKEIARGDGVGAAAHRLGISYATARTQLLQIFGKTEARRQGQLIRLMMKWDLGMAMTEKGHARRAGYVFRASPAAHPGMPVASATGRTDLITREFRESRSPAPHRRKPMN